MFAGSIGVSALSLLSLLDNFTFTPEHIYYLSYLCLTGVIVLLSFIFMIIGIVQSAKKQVFKPMSFTNGLLVLVIIFRLLTVYVLRVSDENFKFDLNNYETIIYLIFAFATYAFYSFIMAVVNVVRYRKLVNPIFSAAKMLSLASAMVSMLALQTAMLTEFSGIEQEIFARNMNFVTGSAVCLLIFGMAVWMIYRADREMKKL
mgnify:CR=1 FL=1